MVRLLDFPESILELSPVLVFPAIHLTRPYVRARVTWYPVVTLCPIPHVPAIHLTRQSAFQGPPRHIRSRDGIDLCPSSTATPSRQHSRAHQLARCFAGRTRRGSMIFAGRSPELPDDVCRKDTEDHRPARLHTGRTRTCLQNVFYFIVNQAAHFCNLFY